MHHFLVGLYCLTAVAQLHLIRITVSFKRPGPFYPPVKFPCFVIILPHIPPIKVFFFQTYRKSSFSRHSDCDKTRFSNYWAFLFSQNNLSRKRQGWLSIHVALPLISMFAWCTLPWSWMMGRPKINSVNKSLEVLIPASGKTLRRVGTLDHFFFRKFSSIPEFNANKCANVSAMTYLFLSSFIALSLQQHLGWLGIAYMICARHRTEKLEY